MKTNAKRMAVALVVATLTISFTNAQTQPNSIDSPNAPTIQKPEPAKPDLARMGERPKKHDERPGGPGGEQGPGRKPRGLTALTSLSGTVGQWVGNDEAILDGFVLTTGSGTTTTVKFPPHLGQQVQKAAKLGSTISVSGFMETGPKNDARFQMTSLTAGKTTLVDTPQNPKSMTSEEPALTTVSGKIADFRTNRDGRVSGLLLDDKTIVTIPPHVAYQLTDLAKKGTSITVQGYPKALHDGQVQLEKLNILRASVLTINGQQYLVR